MQYTKIQFMKNVTENVCHVCRVLSMLHWCVAGSSSQPGSVPQSPVPTGAHTPTMQQQLSPAPGSGTPSGAPTPSTGVPGVPGTAGGGAFPTSMSELQKLVNMQPQVRTPSHYINKKWLWSCIYCLVNSWIKCCKISPYFVSFELLIMKFD